MPTLYGIKNCDTVRAARAWLEARGIDYAFHDFRKDGIDAATLQHWLETLGSDVLVNRRSATWRTLDERLRRQLEQVNPIPVLISNPTLIRRPVLVDGERLQLGFDPGAYQQFFSTKD